MVARNQGQMASTHRRVQNKACAVEGLMWSLKILSWDRIITESSKALSAEVKSQTFIKWRAVIVFVVFRVVF